MNTQKGKLIVIEGTDGSGKETQSNMLRERLQNEGIACGYESFPRYDTPTGRMIKRYLGKAPYSQEFGPANLVNPKMASCLYALDRVAASWEINDLLRKGIHVICNRYVESSMAHQGGKIKNPRERAEMINWIEELEHKDLKIPRADIIVFLYVPHEISQQNMDGRGEKDGHESDLDHMINTERTYIELAERFRWNRINCAEGGEMRTREDIAEEVYRNVRKII